MFMLNKSRPRALAALLAITAWMLSAHPYEGVWHDAVLYMGQALMHSRVPVLGEDTFFAGGSQDRYSIYASVIAPLYEHLGRFATHIGVLLTGWLFMMGAVLALLRRFDPTGRLPQWGLLSFAVMSPFYGGIAVISYGEPFVTARNFSEPLLLWSLVALLDGRRLAAFALQLLAALLHPLMTLPVMAVGWGYLVQTDRRWLWLLMVIPAVLLAALADIAPWSGLAKVYDPYWWALVESSNPMVMLSSWSTTEKLRVLLDVAVLLATSLLRPVDAWTRLIRAVAVITTAFVGLTALGTDVWHSVLLTQLQLWRAHWVAHLLAMTLAPWLTVRLWCLGRLWPASACALALALLHGHFGLDHGIASLSLWALLSLAAWRVHEPSRAIVWLACGSTLLCLLGMSAWQLWDYLGQLAWISPETVWSGAFGKVSANPVVAAGGFAALMYIAARGRPGALAALGLLLFGSLATWDQRPDLARAVESPHASNHPFAAHLPTHAKVYWPNQLAPVWGLLERPSHYASQQGAGLLFNRNTALIFGPHKEMYRLIKSDRESCRAGAFLAKDRASWLSCDMPSPQRLVTLCGQRDAPDFLVLPGRLTAEPLANWQPPARRNLPQTYALYACSQLRAARDSVLLRGMPP
jgi:hypothetical protein